MIPLRVHSEELKMLRRFFLDNFLDMLLRDERERMRQHEIHLVFREGLKEEVVSEIGRWTE